MTIKVRGKRLDPVLQQIVDALREYDQAHPNAEIEAYRHNSVSLRIRVLNPDFANKTNVQREDEIWAILVKLPEETVAEVNQLLLLTPEEAKKSFASCEFDHPIPSKL